MTSLNRFARSANVSINNSRAAPVLLTPSAGLGGQRTTSRATGADSDRRGAGTSKTSKPGTSAKIANQSTSNRFAHFAGMTTMEPIAEDPVLTDISPADAAAFVMASAAKARGQKPAIASKPPTAAAKADMSTPEGVAAFVAASAAKARGARR